MFLLIFLELKENESKNFFHFNIIISLYSKIIIKKIQRYSRLNIFVNYILYLDCLSSDDYAADPYENNKFYRCANGYQTSFRFN